MQANSSRVFYKRKHRPLIETLHAARSRASLLRPMQSSQPVYKARKQETSGIRASSAVVAQGHSQLLERRQGLIADLLTL